VKIPTKVKVGEDWYTVTRVPQLSEGRNRGCVIYDTKEMLIASQGASCTFTPKQKFNTFWHELTHAILEDMGSDLYNDEKFVSMFSDRLTNAITTAKFKP